ncbi:DUF45 domain-containing protein [Candidatus Sumerlaeota bacterium]|nr:DUF45 domain-containing protein [Candidatus Sumerlaeota bacterium]
MTPEHQITQTLRLLMGEEIDLSLNGTDACPVHGRRCGERRLQLRLHPCFRLAPEEVLRILARHLCHPRRDTRDRLLRFVHAAREEIPATPSRRPRLQPVGRHFDLAEIAARINETLFGGSLHPRITWGKAAAPRRRRRRSIVFGSYDHATDTIRIHPDLDSRRTPRHFLEYIVFHEMLHIVHPIQIRADGRRVIHTQAFKRDERRFPRLDRALAYLRRWTGEKSDQLIAD